MILNRNFKNYKLNLVDNGLFYSMKEFELISDPLKNKTILGTGSFGEV